MSRKKALSLLTVALLSVGGCRFWDRSMQDVMNDPLDKANEVESYPVRNTQMAPLATPRSIIVCRSKQCAPIKLSMSKEYIYNSLAQMMKNNNHQKALVCSADVAAATAIRTTFRCRLPSASPRPTCTSIPSKSAT